MAYNQEQKPDYIIDSAFKADIPSLTIYSDIDGAKAYYESYQDVYRSPETIVRNRGGIDITYGPEVFSGLSLDGRHMFTVRMPQMPFGTNLADTQRYFVVSGDFHTKHSTEWWIDKVENNVLFLSHQPISEVIRTDPVDEGLFSLDAVMQRRVAEREQADADYKSFRLTIGQGASISWNHEMRPEGFVSFAEVARQLEVLRMAEERTMGLGGFAHEYSQEKSEVA
jgi:hypothetical protein